MTKATYPSSEVNRNWTTLSRQAVREPITLTVRGKPSLVLTSVEDYELLEKIKLEKLREEVRLGVEQLDRGESSMIEGEQGLRGFMEGIKSRGREALEKEGR